MSLTQPTRITVTWASDGNKNTIPVTRGAGDANNKASYTQGFPQVTMTPKSSGGLPPFGKDMNGILADITQGLRYHQAGMTYGFDSSFATAIGGYNRGALVMQADRSGFWVSTKDANTSNPETHGSDWIPLNNGSLQLTLSNANKTLTPAQAAHPIVILSGAITNNIIVFFPTFLQTWVVINNCTGNYSITCKTANGSGVAIMSGVNQIVCDGTNIQRVGESQASLVPTGAVLPFFGTTVPDGYVVANGQGLSTTVYAGLFAIYGYKYGGSGTPFNVPNLIGRFIRYGNASDVGTRVADSLKSHTHTVTQTAHTHSISDSGHSHTGSTNNIGLHSHTMGEAGNHTHKYLTRDGTGESNYAQAEMERKEGSYNGYMTSSGNHTHSLASNGNHQHTLSINSATTGVSVQGATANISVNATGATETAPMHIYGLPIIKC